MLKFRDYLQPLGIRHKPVDPNATRYADVMDRAAAAAIDLVLLIAIFQDVFIWFSRRIYAHADQSLIAQAQATQDAEARMQLFIQSGALHLWLLNSALQVLVIGTFIVGMQILWQATPGKWLLGLKIVRRGTLERPAAWRYVVRFIGCIIAALPLMIGVIWASFNKERRGWHDMLAGTVVIHTRPHGWYWAQVKKAYRRLRGKPPADTPPQQ